MMDQQAREALNRIARTADGQALYRYLQQELCQVTAAIGRGALRHENGRRSLAHDLMAVMAEGIASDRTDTTFIPAKRDAAGPARKLTAREWIAAQPSWLDAPGDAETSGTT